jgi:electron transfer flavoprotein beta subunit
VPDTTTKISFKNDDKELNEAGVQFIVNPYDEWYALVRALELKEAAGSGTVTLIHVGTATNEPTMRKALAIGADDAVRIDVDAKDAYEVAEQIAAYAKDQNYDLIMTGKETISYNGGLVAGILAELLDRPYISMATKLDLAGDVATIEHDIDGGTEVVECPLPLVLSANKGMSEARIPNMRGIMAARSKPLVVVPAASTIDGTSVASYKVAEGRTECKMLPDADALVQALRNEAKAI